MARARAAFPIGLYATLLLALCWLSLPELLRPVERALLGLACLPLRWSAAAIVVHADAAGATAARAAELQRLGEQLAMRSRQHEQERGRALLPAGLEPLTCRVRAVHGKGGGGVPCELLLDHSYEELAGCTDLVTCGDVLLGFLARPGVGPAADDRPDDPARVLLLSHAQSREVAAVLPLPGGGALRCVLGPAAVVDPAPLRTTLFDDPYRAARLQQGDGAVRTAALDATWIGAVPGDLLIGHSRVWGYGTGEAALTIGIYVQPALDARALPQVVVWQSLPELVPAARTPQWRQARARPLPDGAGSRWLVTAAGPLPDGAAIVQDGVCLGTVRALAFGQGLCTSFAGSRHQWSVWLMPDDVAQPPLGLFGEVVFADARTAWFRPRGGGALPAAGFLFTGSNGPHCPPGLLLGHAEPDAARRLLRVAVPARSGTQQVLVAAEAP